MLVNLSKASHGAAAKSIAEAIGQYVECVYVKGERVVFYTDSIIDRAVMERIVNLRVYCLNKTFVFAGVETFVTTKPLDKHSNKSGYETNLKIVLVPK